jgi:hypothetical protein
MRVGARADVAGRYPPATGLSVCLALFSPTTSEESNVQFFWRKQAVPLLSRKHRVILTFF